MLLHPQACWNCWDFLCWNKDKTRSHVWRLAYGRLTHDLLLSVSGRPDPSDNDLIENVVLCCVVGRVWQKAGVRAEGGSLYVWTVACAHLGRLHHPTLLCLLHCTITLILKNNNWGINSSQLTASLYVIIFSFSKMQSTIDMLLCVAHMVDAPLRLSASQPTLSLFMKPRLVS